jgi:cytoskeletal protein RodZ
MSLINDALKQAGKAQQENPPPESNLHFRPAEERPHRSYTPPAIMYAVFVVVLVLGGLLVLLALRKSPEVVKAKASRTSSKAAAIPDTPASAAPVEANPIVFPPKPAAPPVAEPPPATQTPPTATSSQEPPQAAPKPINTPTEPTAAPTTPTNATAVAPPVEPPKPAKPKLQGISYNPTRPSAVINGRTLYVGDRMGEFNVREITKDAVTLVSATQTYVLSLSD